MIIDLTAEEIELIHGWYRAADGESYTHLQSSLASKEEKALHLALLKKFGFELAPLDKYTFETSGVE